MNPFLITSLYGILHAFEADHVLAVSGLVAGKRNIGAALKDGIFWGLGHTFTIVLFGLLVKLFAVSFHESVFVAFESGVGLMLIGIGISRLKMFFKGEQGKKHDVGGKAAFSTGVVHGMAGSGPLILLLLPGAESSITSFISLGLFGIGSLAGMSVAAVIGFLPFYRNYLHKIAKWLLLLSAVLCIGYGFYVFAHNALQIF